MTRDRFLRIAADLRATARELFEDPDLDLDLRDAPWVDTDSYDAGVVAVAKTLLARADKYEAVAARMTP